MSPIPSVLAQRARSASIGCALLLLAAQPAGAAVVWTDLGNVSNSTIPSVWELKTLDVTALVTGATDADLSFGLRNDADSPGLTVSKVEFGVDGADYFARFTYVTGDDTSHWRDVRLVVDGLLYVDQFGAYNDHLGSPVLGTLYQGGTGEPGVYVLQREIPEVPEPGVLALVGLGFAGIGLARRRGRRTAS